MYSLVLMKLFRLTALLFLSLASIAATAQTGVYGMFSAARAPDSSSPNWLYGGTGGIYFDRGHLAVFETGIDARAVFIQQSNSGDFISDKLVGGFVGPRLAVRTRVLPLKPYGEALIGIARTEGGGENNSRFPNPSQTGLAYALALGADLTILPRIDWRVVEFSVIGAPQGHRNDKATISSGLVVRF